SIYSMSPRLPTPSPFPYTTLFRSHARRNHARSRKTRRCSQSRGRRSRQVRRAPYHVTVTVTETAFATVEEAIEDIRAGKFVVVVNRKSTRLNSSHVAISYAVFCLK